MGAEFVILAIFQAVMLVVMIANWLVPQPPASQALVAWLRRSLRAVPLAVMLIAASLALAGLSEHPLRATFLALSFALVVFLSWQALSPRQVGHIAQEQKPESTPQRREPSRVIQEGVLWEDEGGYDANIEVGGPYCPHDLTPLAYRSNRSQYDDHDPAWGNDLVSDYHGKLSCPECGKAFMFSSALAVEDVRGRAGLRLVGARKRRGYQ